MSVQNNICKMGSCKHKGMESEVFATAQHSLIKLPFGGGHGIDGAWCLPSCPCLSGRYSSLLSLKHWSPKNGIQDSPTCVIWQQFNLCLKSALERTDSFVHLEWIQNNTGPTLSKLNKSHIKRFSHEFHSYFFFWKLTNLSIRAAADIRVLEYSSTRLAWAVSEYQFTYSDTPPLTAQAL